jgi:hypothetical protein
MKNLILFALLFIPFSLIAQIEVDNRKTSMNDQTDQWMTKISSDSEMRTKMMDMMITKTSGNKEEMMKLVNSMLNNPEMYKMILANNPGKADNNDISVEPRGVKNESIKVGKVYTTEPVSPKK